MAVCCFPAGAQGVAVESVLGSVPGAAECYSVPAARCPAVIVTQRGTCNCFSLKAISTDPDSLVISVTLGVSLKSV